MDPTAASLTTHLWIALLRWALHITVDAAVVDAITDAAAREDVPVERLFAVCFRESTLGQGRPALLCGYQGRISDAERVVWASTFGGAPARTNARWQALHAAHALRRWHDNICTRGADALRWDHAAAFYNNGEHCQRTSYSDNVAETADRVATAVMRREDIGPELAMGDPAAEDVCHH